MNLVSSLNRPVYKAKRKKNEKEKEKEKEPLLNVPFFHGKSQIKNHAHFFSQAHFQNGPDL
jgi:hypothetical protein